jgi:hypothetical protein
MLSRSIPFEINFDISTENLLIQRFPLEGMPFPKPPEDFLLLDGTDFLLLDGSNFLLL